MTEDNPSNTDNSAKTPEDKISGSDLLEERKIIAAALAVGKTPEKIVAETGADITYLPTVIQEMENERSSVTIPKQLQNPSFSALGSRVIEPCGL